MPHWPVGPGTRPPDDPQATSIISYTLRRLVALKRRVDPDSRFRRNHNVPPDLAV